MDNAESKIVDSMSMLDSVPLPAECYNQPYNQLRRAKLLVFGACLHPYDKFQAMSYQEKVNLIKAIERACYNCTIEKAGDANITTSWNIEPFCNLYVSTCYKVSSNLEKGGIVNNTQLAQQLLDGSISIENLPKLSAQEMFPQKYTDIIQKLEASKNVEIGLRTSAMYKCRKCKQNKCTIENLYNRSLDEGVNLKIHCLNCGHSWNG
jgi:DNA-directed RNA polymerase subunit M/transcription elongation factor TFIIS